MLPTSAGAAFRAHHSICTQTQICSRFGVECKSACKSGGIFVTFRGLFEVRKMRAFAYFYSGGEGEIRTPEPREGLPVFKTGAINRSATSPGFACAGPPRGGAACYQK